MELCTRDTHHTKETTWEKKLEKMLMKLKLEDDDISGRVTIRACQWRKIGSDNDWGRY